MIRLTRPAHGRVRSLDFLRGFDLVLMVLFNYSVTLAYFGIISRQPDSFYWTVYPALIAGVFIFLSGAVSRLAFEKHGKNLGAIYFSRGFKLLAFAVLITLFTYVFVPKGTIFFGILHFFALSSFLVPFLVKLGKPNLSAGLLVILAGFLLQQTQFDFSYLLWLGLMPNNFFTLDYFPLLPWLGVLMLGIHFSKSVVEKARKLEFNGTLADAVVFLGKNSLIIYLVHQPILVLLLAALGFKLP